VVRTESQQVWVDSFHGNRKWEDIRRHHDDLKVVRPQPVHAEEKYRRGTQTEVRANPTTQKIKTLQKGCIYGAHHKLG